MNLLNLHPITLVFIVLELILLVYQLFRLIFYHAERKCVLLLLLPISLIVYNLNDGFTMGHDYQDVINTVLLLLYVFLIFKFNIILSPNKLETRLANLKQKKQLKEIFLQNCLKYGLSAREIEVVILLRDGHKYKDRRNLVYIAKHRRYAYTKYL
jgi:hypothetical protein